jgi:hypothetical protein
VRIEIDKRWPVCALLFLPSSCLPLDSSQLQVKSVEVRTTHLNRERQVVIDRTPVLWDEWVDARIARQFDLLLEQQTVDRQVNQSRRFRILFIVSHGARTESDLDTREMLVFVGRSLSRRWARHGRRRFHVRHERQSARCTTDTDANFDARAKKCRCVVRVQQLGHPQISLSGKHRVQPSIIYTVVYES